MFVVCVPAQEMVQSVTQLSLVWSSVGVSVRGAVRCHVGGQSLPPDPEGVTTTTARTALYLPSQCTRAEKVPSASALSFSIPWARVVRVCQSHLARHPKPRHPAALSLQNFVSSVTRNQPVTSQQKSLTAELTLSGTWRVSSVPEPRTL